MATAQLSYTAAQIDAAIAKINALITTIRGSIVQLYDGANPIYPRTSSNAVFFNNDPTNTLTAQIAQINAILGEGYSYLGIANLSTTPPSIIEGKIFYIATQAGPYTNFLDSDDNSIFIQNKGLYILKYNNLNEYWEVETIPFKTDQIFDENWQQFQEDINLNIPYDISIAHSDTQYISLSAALGINGENIPQDIRRGGLTVKFINSSTNKYEQWSLNALSWSIDISDWTLVNVDIDLPITEETTASEDEEMKFIDDAGSQSYVKIGAYGIKSNAYLNMQGENVIPVKDTLIGDSPSTTNVPTSEAVANYVNKHGSSHISDEDTQDSEEVVAVKSNDEINNVFSAGFDKTLNKYPNFQAPNISFWTTGKGTAYNRQYGWGGHPYGHGTLPLYTTIDSVLEAQMFSVCGGKGRWNETDTGNFDYGGHLFEGWNSLEDARLTMGIGLHHKDVGWLQVFHPATEQGTDHGAYYGVTIVGSDEDAKGVAFMPHFHYETHAVCLLDMSYGMYMAAPRITCIEKLIETGQMPASAYNATKKGVKGALYYSEGDKAFKFFNGTNWLTFGTQITEFRVTLQSDSRTGYEIPSGIKCNYHQAFSTIISPKTGYTLPETLNTIKSDNREVEFTYDNTTGAISIAANIIEGYVEIYVV